MKNIQELKSDAEQETKKLKALLINVIEAEIIRNLAMNKSRFSIGLSQSRFNLIENELISAGIKFTYSPHRGITSGKLWIEV